MTIFNLLTDTDLDPLRNTIADHEKRLLALEKAAQPSPVPAPAPIPSPAPVPIPMPFSINGIAYP